MVASAKARTEQGETYLFGEYILNGTERRLTRAGAAVVIPPRLFDALEFFLENPDSLITKAEMTARLWPDVKVEESSLARAISDLRKILDSGGGDTYIQTVPKYGYRWVAPVELSQRLAVQTPGPDQPASTVIPVHSRIKYFAAGLVALFVTALTIWATGVLPSNRPPIRSIAILPFLSLDKSPDDVLQLGIPDMLIVHLSRIPDLEVRSMASVRSYVGDSPDPVKAGQKLKVDAVLEGTLITATNTRRIDLRLLSARNGRSLWSGSVSRPVNDVKGLEEAAAEFAARATTGRELTREPTLAARPAIDDDTYRLYLEGRYFFGKRTRTDFPKAIDRLRTCVFREPEFAEAHAMLAEALLVSSGYGYRNQTEVAAEVLDHANRAIALQPKLSHGHRVLALFAENYEYDRAKAEREYRRALELDPNDASAHHLYGELLGLSGKFSDEERELATASRLDPLSLAIQTDAGQQAWFARNYDLAERRLEHVLELDPQFSRAANQLGTVRLYRNLSSTSCKQPVPPHFPDIFICGAGGGLEERRQLLARVEENHTSYTGMFDLHSKAVVYAWYGQYGEAIAALEKMFETHQQPGIIGLETSPLFDPLRSHQEFQALLRRTGGVEPEAVREDVRRRWPSH